MKEVKSPKKPLIYYYGIVLIVIVLFNLFVTPIIQKHQVTEVDYGKFMAMIEDKSIEAVEVEDSQIIFTDKDTKKTMPLSGVSPGTGNISTRWPPQMRKPDSVPIP